MKCVNCINMERMYTERGDPDERFTYCWAFRHAVMLGGGCTGYIDEVDKNGK